LDTFSFILKGIEVQGYLGASSDEKSMPYKQ